MVYYKFNPEYEASNYKVGEKYLFYTHFLMDSKSHNDIKIPKEYAVAFTKDDEYLTGKVSGLKIMQYVGIITSVSNNRVTVLAADGSVRDYGCPYRDYVKNGNVLNCFINEQALPLDDPKKPGIQIYPNGMRVNSQTGEIVGEAVNDNTVAAIAGVAAKVDGGTARPVASKKTKLTGDTKGSTLIPESGSNLIPDKGTSLEPENGSEIVPDHGASIVPDEGSTLVPENGSGIIPDNSSELLPD